MLASRAYLARPMVLVWKFYVPATISGNFSDENVSSGFAFHCSSLINMNELVTTNIQNFRGIAKTSNICMQTNIDRVVIRGKEFAASKNQIMEIRVKFYLVYKIYLELIV